MMPSEYDGKQGPLPTGKQDTSYVAREALKEQTGLDIFNLPESEQVVLIRGRLDEITGEVSDLYNKLCGPMPMPGSYPSKAPPYAEKEDIQEEIDRLEREKTGLRFYLREVYEAMEGMDKTDDTPDGPFAGTALSVIGSDGQMYDLAQKGGSPSWTPAPEWYQPGSRKAPPAAGVAP